MIFIGPGALVGRHVDDASVAAIANELAVELGPAFGVDLALKAAADVEIGARPKFLGDEITRSIAHPFLDVVA